MLFNKIHFLLTAYFLVSHFAPDLFAQCDSAQSVAEYADSITAPSTHTRYAAGLFFPDPQGKHAIHVPMSHVMPTFKFSLGYPSLESDINIIFSEFRLNGQKIGLKNWCNNQEIIGWDEERLNSHSRTFDFSVHAGDTITFFRQLRYRHHQKSSQQHTKLPYLSLDDIAWSVELKDALTHQRIMQLDSLIIYRNLDEDMQIAFRGLRPLTSKVSASIPATQPIPERVYIQVNMFKHGPSKQQFKRRDYLVAGLLSEHHTAFSPQVSQSQMLSKAYARYDRMFKLSPNPSQGSIYLEVSGAELPKRTKETLMIHIFNSKGELITSQPLYCPASTTQFTYTLVDNGAYFVQISSHDQILFHQQITVAR
ncbi:MAG: hypothetical protein RML40_06060 [Bacteroidota bacterium]|nr:T9SS type A sorting domain-containing protein [Candidatus Kapabacteria bacterium]MDW8220078.1 hypothetical protein [Bacteroidota bacterium]